MRDSYQVTDSPNPHIERARAIVRQHPEVRRYFTHYPATGGWITALVVLQVAIAWRLRDAHWLWVIVTAYGVGAFASHALFVLIHEATHNLIVRGTVANRLFGILCNVGQGFPSAMSFRTYHLLHHFHLDEYDYDADLAFPREARWVGNSPLRKALWLLVFAATEIVRPLHVKRPFMDPWITFNGAVIILTNLLIWQLGGLHGLAYIGLSTVFGIGLHPVGARWIQEHYTFVEGQETYSYYGPLNRIAFNIGYHNEHHDLIKVPWVYLPRIKAMAPELYDHLHSHSSWTRVLMQWLFDPKMHLFARITRVREREIAA